MREVLEKIYIDIHGGVENVNLIWLSLYSDEEIIGVITAAGKFGVAVNETSLDYVAEKLRITVPALRRDRQAKKLAKENSDA